MVDFNSDGSIRLPDHLVKKHADQRNTKLVYEKILQSAKSKKINILFLIEDPEKNKISESDLKFLFEAFQIKSDDLLEALEKLLAKGHFIQFIKRNEKEVALALRSILSELHPERILVIGDNFNKKLGFIREDGRFIDEMLTLDNTFAKKIKIIINSN